MPFNSSIICNVLSFVVGLIITRNEIIAIFETYRAIIVKIKGGFSAILYT